MRVGLLAKCYVRCSKCNGRRVLARHPSQYIRLPRCKRCGRKMTTHPLTPTDPHYRIDRYRPKRERGRAARPCDPAKTGCGGYHFVHRRGSGFCVFNPKLTEDDLKARWGH